MPAGNFLSIANVKKFATKICLKIIYNIWIIWCIIYVPISTKMNVECIDVIFFDLVSSKIELKISPVK